MINLQDREDKIKAKRKNTPFRDFIGECGSRRPMTFYKNRWHISRYPQSDRIQNIVSTKDHQEMRHERHDRDYSGDFLDDIRLLLEDVPIAAINQHSSENCEYSDASFNVKNVYLSMVTTRWSENVAYSFIVKDNSTNIFSSTNILEKSENIYASSYVIQSYNVFFSDNIINSNNMRFSANCIGCHECIDCDGLENISYCIANKKLEKEIYEEEKKAILRQKEKFHKKKSISPINMGCSESTWSNLYNCNNVIDGHYCVNVQKARNVVFASSTGHDNNFSDVFIGGRSTNFYGVCDAWWQSDNCYSISQCGNSTSMYYCLFCESCSFCLGCIWLENKSFCILNRQYSKEERYNKVDEIFWQMERDGSLGDFFPWSMCPFYFNDTAAYLIDPSFTREEATAKWYLRRDEPIKVDIPDNTIVIKTSDLDHYESFDSEGNRNISAGILSKVIQDESWNVYRVVKMEYDFLMKHWLPLPRKHRLDRMKENFTIS